MIISFETFTFIHIKTLRKPVLLSKANNKSYNYLGLERLDKCGYLMGCNMIKNTKSRFRS